MVEPLSGLLPRIIPCLDVDGGRVVKGTRFKNLREMGDAVDLAERYERDGADELVFLDISATLQARKTVYDLVERVARRLTIPLTLGGGLRSIEDVDQALNSGADKVCINTAALMNPGLIRSASRTFGSQCIQVAIDVHRIDPGTWGVKSHAGQRAAHRDALEWAREVASLGAGELLVTSIDRDGTGDGYDLDFLALVLSRVRVPVIASGGARHAGHLIQALRCGASAVLAASMFHSDSVPVHRAKCEIARAGIAVRPVSGRHTKGADDDHTQH